MRGLKKIAHNGAVKHTNRQTDQRTWQLQDQLDPEGRVGEKCRGMFSVDNCFVKPDLR